MKVLVVGLGSIARRHIKNMKTLAPECELVVWRQHSRDTDARDVGEWIDRVVFDQAEALAWEPEVALVTNPASRHIEAGLALAKAGCDLFIEKPLADGLPGVDELLYLCRERALTLMVGYNFRYSHSLQSVQQVIADGGIGRVVGIRAEVGQYLPDWRPGTDYRQGVSAKRELGGGVLLELSHELDFVRWLVGEVETVYARVGSFGDLGIEVEDTAELILEFANGAVGSVHLDMLQRATTRVCRVVGTDGTLEWDGVAQTARLYSAADRCWTDVLGEGAGDRNDMYMEELRHFLNCVKNKRAPDSGGEDGRRVLEIVAAARESSRMRKVVAI